MKARDSHDESGRSAVAAPGRLGSLNSPIRRVCLAVLAIGVAAQAECAFAQLAEKIADTPILIQDAFGPVGDLLPYDGLGSCFPTSFAMDLSYLGANGYSQVAPGNPNAAQALNLVEVMSGLMGTSAISGTTSNGIQMGFTEYMAMKGISTANYAITPMDSPTMSVITAMNQPGAAVTLGISFYNSDGTPAGGHAVTLLGTGVNAQGQASPNTVVVANPEPGALSPNADTVANGIQYLNTIPTSGNLAADGAIQMDPNQYPAYYATTSMSVIAACTSLTINQSQLASNNPAPAPWSITAMEPVGLDGGYLSVLAPITGAGGLLKGTGGELELEAVNNSTGANYLISGILRSDVASGLPFGTGSMNVHAGTLELAPGGSAANVNLTVASGSGNTFQYLYGATLILEPNANNSLTVTLGGNTNGTTANVVRQSNGTLVIAPAGGTADLGVNERVFVAGSSNNLPSTTNGIVNPYVVGQDNDSAGSGDFLTYGANGYAKAAYIQASTTALTAAATTTIYEANIAQTIPANATAQVFALKVDQVTIGGGAASVLKDGGQTGGHAGLILNGGTVAAANLNFAADEAMIYTSNAGGTISSVIQGTGGITTFGPGAITLSGANTNTGAMNVNSGTLIAANSSGSATGKGAVTVEENATLEISGASAVAGSASGTTITGGTGSLVLNGGTLTGPLTVSGGYVVGRGTISGTATVEGTIGTNSQDPLPVPYTGVENINFSGAATFDTSTTYYWRLNALDDNPNNAGVNWSLLQFTSKTAAVAMGSPSDGFYFGLDLAASLPDPNSGNAFWDSPHQWLIATDPAQFATVDYNPNFPTFAQGSFGLNVDDALQNVYLDYTPAPEPSTAALLALSTVGTLCLRRRRR